MAVRWDHVNNCISIAHTIVLTLLHWQTHRQPSTEQKIQRLELVMSQTAAREMEHIKVVCNRDIGNAHTDVHIVISTSVSVSM